MKQSPRIIIENEILEGLINISLNYMSTNQIQVAKNIIVFFQFFIKFQNSNLFKEMLQEDKILAENCKKIVQNH